MRNAQFPDQPGGTVVAVQRQGGVVGGVTVEWDKGPKSRAPLRTASKPDALVPEPAGRSCRVCGCTERDCRQCVAKTGAPCSWVEGEPDLCTACADAEDEAIGDEMGVAWCDHCLSHHGDLGPWCEACGLHHEAGEACPAAGDEAGARPGKKARAKR